MPPGSSAVPLKTVNLKLTDCPGPSEPADAIGGAGKWYEVTAAAETGTTKRHGRVIARTSAIAAHGRILGTCRTPLIISLAQRLTHAPEVRVRSSRGLDALSLGGQTLGAQPADVRAQPAAQRFTARLERSTPSQRAPIRHTTGKRDSGGLPTSVRVGRV